MAESAEDLLRIGLLSQTKIKGSKGLFGKEFSLGIRGRRDVKGHFLALKDFSAVDEPADLYGHRCMP